MRLRTRFAMANWTRPLDCSRRCSTARRTRFHDRARRCLQGSLLGLARLEIHRVRWCRSSGSSSSLNCALTPVSRPRAYSPFLRCVDSERAQALRRPQSAAYTHQGKPSSHSNPSPHSPSSPNAYPSTLHPTLRSSLSVPPVPITAPSHAGRCPDKRYDVVSLISRDKGVREWVHEGIARLLCPP